MGVVKRSVTLDEDVASDIEGVVGGRGFSAWLNDAARAKLDRENVRALLADLDSEFGPLPAEQLHAARRRWAELVAEPAADEGQMVDLLAALETSVREVGGRKAARPKRRRAAG